MLEWPGWPDRGYLANSVNEVLLDLIRHQRMARMDGSLELLRERAKATADVDVDHLVERLNLAPFRV